jgi:zinc protease
VSVDRSRLPVVGPDPLFRFPAIVRHTLPNGLNVRTIEHHTVPLVTLVLQASDGAGADPADRHGLAAITADMLDEGTGTLSAIDVSEAMARIGAEFDVEIAPDATALTLTTLARFADRGATLLADIVTRPSMRPGDFERIRQLRLDRLRQLRDVPPAVAERAFLRLLYRDHPYGHLQIGTDGALRAMTLEDVVQFHRDAYRPSRVTLVVAGAMPHDELRAIAERAFGAWTEPRNGRPPREPSQVEPAFVPGTRLAVVPREAAAQSELRIGHLAARRDTPDYAALLVMNAVLGGQFVSRVNLKLREEKGYTYGARTGFDWRRGLSPFLLQASVHTASTVDAIRDSLDELSAIRGARPVNDGEMLLAKATLTRGYPRNFETTQQVARSVAQLVLYDLPDTYFEDFVPRVNAIDGDAVTHAARSYLDPARLVTLVVGDHQAIGGSLGALQLGEPMVLSADA